MRVFLTLFSFTLLFNQWLCVMKHVYLASQNPVKVKAVEAGFRRMFPDSTFIIHPLATTIQLPAQPDTDAVTFECAKLRAQNARQQAPDGDYWVGIEGGVAERQDEMSTFAWTVILDSERMGKGRSAEFYLPKIVADLVRSGVELGEADDRIFSRKNSKQKNGAVGLLTRDAVTRLDLYIPAVVFALIPFQNPELFI